VYVARILHFNLIEKYNLFGSFEFHDVVIFQWCLILPPSNENASPTAQVRDFDVR